MIALKAVQRSAIIRSRVYGATMIDQNRLNLLFPDWQGYGGSNAVHLGALQLAKALECTCQFESIAVPPYEELSEEDGVIGLSANLRLLRHARTTLTEHNPARTFMIGGTCASEISPVSFLNRKFDSDLAVLWFDAHGDLNTPETSPSRQFHGMPLRALLGDGHPAVLDLAFSILEPRQVFLLGVRDLDPSEQDFIKSANLCMFPPDKLSHPDRWIAEISGRGFTKVYIHVDLDVLEPDSFPHLLMPTPGGIEPHCLTTALEALKKSFHVAGFSVVEFAPTGKHGIQSVLKFIEAVM